MIKRILFASDLGAFTSHALLHVESLANHYDSKIYIVHAVPPLGDLASAVVKSHCSQNVKNEVLQTPHIKGLLESIKEEVFEQILDAELLDTTFSSKVQDIIVNPGNPAVVILSEAEKLDVDLIVIGSHSTDAIDGRILGSVAAKILQLSKVPVYLVPMMNSSVLGLHEVVKKGEWRKYR